MVTTMAKFYGTIAFAEQAEDPPESGIWKEKMVLRKYGGDLIRNTRRLHSGDYLNDNINVSNQISIVADPYFCKNFHSIRYVEFMGAKWKVAEVDVQYPRLILTLGGVYNGQQTRSAETARNDSR